MLCISRGDDVPGSQCRHEARNPIARVRPRLRFVMLSNFDRCAVRGNRIFVRAILVDKAFTREFGAHALDRIVLPSLVGSGLLACALRSCAIGEIDGLAQQRPQIADWMACVAQMFPRCVDNIGESLGVFASFAHEFENQKITKS